ncbi:hypothetical protein [Xanthomonas euroxanthea]|uniref:hypothetical protein n=1 Tax=Xanthomonas euroxanthea TaxID=2259622 RepID=UPI00162105DC|nr:hypothetical protein [Xanthomonas euroxanthea]MBB5766108.1 hypothetical protein [Xanthomonas euroxanthea]
MPPIVATVLITLQWISDMFDAAAGCRHLPWSAPWQLPRDRRSARSRCRPWRLISPGLLSIANTARRMTTPDHRAMARVNWTVRANRLDARVPAHRA